MKKLFTKFSMLLILLAMSVNAVWADMQKIYVASLKAQTSSESTGSGDVKLTWLDIKGEEMNVDLAHGLNNAALGNPSHISEGETAQLIGGTLFAMDGIETAIGSDHIYMTSYLYFLAEGEPANGSYFSHWTFTDPAISRIDTAMGHMKSPCFKVLPDTTNNGKIDANTGNGDEKFGVSMTNVVTNPKNLYAVFKKYLLSNPVVTNNGVAGTSTDATTTLDVFVDIEGDMSQLKPTYADFDMPANIFFENDDVEWSWALAANPFEMLSATKGRAHAVVTFKAKKDISEGTYRATFPIRMQGSNPSALNIQLSVYARPESTNEASVKIGDAAPEEYATLTEAVASANSAEGDVVLTLLKDIAVSSTVTLTNTMTLDLNGYVLSAAAAAAPGPGMVGQPVLKVAGAGETVTLAYNKQGGAIQAAPAVGVYGVMGGFGVEVAAGTLVLNGGTIASENALTGYAEAALTAAIKVDEGATLIQNGATITATSAGPNAFGIYNEGTVVIRDGSVRAEAGFNNAMAVYAMNGSTTTIAGGSLSALAKEENGTCAFNGNSTPEAIATWTNAYAVNVAAGSTVTVNGGDLYAEATNPGRAYAVSALAGFGGTLTVNKGATVRAKSPNNMYSFPVAIMAGNVTINGGKFDGKYMDNTTGETSNPAVFGVDYSKFTFVSGTCMTEKFFTEDDRISASFDHPVYKNYNVVKDSKDYVDGYRYIAVAEDANPAVAVPACRIGSVGYSTLEDAIAYANNNPSEEVVIFMMRDYTLPAGYYTLPAKATIVVPMSDEQAKEINAFPPRMSFNDMDRTHPYLEPTEFRRLTIANGVNMNVYGKIEMTCTQFASNEAYTGQPYGPYGRIVMDEGSHLTLMSGSEVRAWGFMTGKGEIDVRRDAIVREMFQLGDWKGALTSVKITGMMPEDSPITIGDDSDKKIFPVSQYFIQNIESPVKYHPGAVLSTSAMVSEGLSGFLAVSMTASDIKIVGVNGRDSAIFVMDNGADAENTWVRKWYDVENDIQVYEVNNSAHIGQMVLDMGELDASFLIQGFSIPVRLNSGKFDLPITCNFKIHLLSGAMDFLQNTSLLPGAEVEVDKEATVSVAMDEVEKNTYDAWVEGGKQGEAPISYTGALYVYDAANWGEYAYGNAYNPESGSNETYTAYTKIVRYSPSWDGRPTKRDEHTCPPSAAINVHGTFQTSMGFVYTSANGANIFSSNEDAGTFIFNDDAVDAGERKVYNVEESSTYRSLTFTPAQLKNGNGEHINTSEAVAGDAYCYINDEWTTMYPDEDNPCFMVKHNTNGDVFYAKPQEYVAVAATKDPNTKLISGNDDHTFSDADGAGRLFILMNDNCQWWEVEKKDNLYHCIHPNNDTYYYWQEEVPDPYDPDVMIPAHWEEKRFSITWKNWNGDIIQTIGAMEELVDSYSVTYGTMAEFNGNNPTREANVDSTYNFTGWKPALGPVTQDVTYTATFESQPRMYTIIFQNEGGSEIERHFLTHNEVPACENTPTKAGHYLIWSPAISPVVGDQTYVATWEEELPTEWDVTFVNNAGGVLTSTEKVGVNEHPSYTGTTPTKENADHTPYSSNEYTYTFWGWSAVIDGVAQQFAAEEELPSPTAPTTFTAVYTEAAKTYDVKFVTYKGTATNPNHVIASGSYTYGATPIAPTVEQVLAAIADESTPNYTFNNDKYTYSFAWDPQIQTVMRTQNYTATIDSVINQYTVTLKSNLSGVCTFVGAGTYNYGKDDIRVSVIYNKSKYSFKGWTGTSRADTTFILGALKGDSTLTANFEPKELNDKMVAKDETWDIPDNTEVKDLIITSDGSNASQLQNVANLTIRGEAIFRLEKDFAAQTWYAVAVPWKVALSGIRDNSGNTFATNSIYVLEFDANAYASANKENGRNDYWHFLDQSGHDMQPGKLYMIWFRNAQTAVEFHKKSGASLVTNNTSVALASGSYADQSNWNAIANPALYYASLSTGAEDGDVLKYNGNDSYVPGSTSNMIVGEPMFVQVSAPSTVYATPAGGASPAPYRRALQETTANNRFVVELTQAGRLNDRMIVQTAEEKANEYVIGKDLAKMGVSALNAQMWINRYDAKLCKNTLALQGEQVEYPLNISAPAAGEYVLSAMQERGNATLYLTRNGEAIWNLTESDYVLHLEKGTAANYGLRVSAKAPQVATGIDEAVVDAQGETKKVLINNQVFIIRGEKVYTIDGQMVK